MQAGTILLASDFPKIRLDIIASSGIIQQVTLRHASALEFQVLSQQKDPALEEKLLVWLEAYGRKEPLSLKELPLVFPTSFMGDAWKALVDIPFGEVRTYQEVAIALNNPRAPRAVGTACRRNPYPIFIPCHRVLPKGRSGVGNFAFGSPMKELLLSFESSTN